LIKEGISVQEPLVCTKRNDWTTSAPAPLRPLPQPQGDLAQEILIRTITVTHVYLCLPELIAYFFEFQASFHSFARCTWRLHGPVSRTAQPTRTFLGLSFHSSPNRRSSPSFLHGGLISIRSQAALRVAPQVLQPRLKHRPPIPSTDIKSAKTPAATYK
jgi:hypothetical protein